MNVNTLVRHKRLKSAGIGCVAKIVGKKVRVNFGLDDTMLCSPSQLEEVDVSECKTINVRQYRDRILKDKSSLNHVIVGNELREYVGIGWVTLRTITEQDLKTYHRVVD